MESVDISFTIHPNPPTFLMSDQLRRPIPGGRSSYKDNNDVDVDGRKKYHPLSQTKRRKQAAISLTKFSTKKGHDRALQEYKKRKETKFQKNATLLRVYQKAMKKEGYDAGRGASRKRRSTGDLKEGVVDDNVVVGEKEITSNNNSKDFESVDSMVRKKKRQKADPLHHAKKEADRRRTERIEAITTQEVRQKEMSKREQERKVRAKKMMQRTRRGQPLIKNVIGDLLIKIKSDVEGDGKSA